MKDTRATIGEAPPEILVQIMKLRDKPERFWRPEELGDVLKHQLAAPMDVGLSRLDKGAARRLRTVCAAEELLLNSLGDLFSHPHPPIEMLVLVKDFAKAIGHHPDSPIPEEISTVIYLAAIVVAMVRCGERITDLDDAALRESVQWALSQKWLDAETRLLFQEGSRAIKKVGSIGP